MPGLHQLNPLTQDHLESGMKMRRPDMRIIRYQEKKHVYMGVVTEDGQAYRLADRDFISLVKRARAKA